MSNTGDENLNLTITADASSGTAAVSDMEARLAGLETQFNKSTTASAGLSTGLSDLASHSLTAARGFEALGLNADAAAAKIDGLAKVLEEVEAAAPGLLVIGAALAVLSASFDFFKDGVKLAGEFESQMVSLGTAVRLQGGNWDAASEGVRKYLETQELATGYNQNEVLTALNQLVVKGASLKDAYYEVEVAEDAAAATHTNLLDVVNLLTSAEGQRATGLERLDPQLKDLIQRHADLFTIMQKLESDMSGQAVASLDTYEGKVRASQAAWDTFKQDVGVWLLPWLKDVNDELELTARSLDTMGQKMSHGDIIGGLAAGLGIGLPSAASAQAQRAAQIRNQHGLDRDPSVGNAGSGGGYDPSLIDLTRDSTNYADPTKDTDRATQVMRAFASVEADLDAKMKGATSSSEAQADKIALLTQKVTDAKDEVAILSGIVTDDEKAWNAQASAVKAMHAALNDAQKAENTYEQSLKGTQTLSEAQKDQQHALADAVKQANDKYEEARQTLDRLGTTLKSHDQLLQQASKDVQTFGADYAQAMAAQDKASADFYQKENDQYQESVRTFGATNAQKVAIYREMTLEVEGDDEHAFELRQQLTQKAQDALIASYNDIDKAYKKWVDDATKETETFIDDIVEKHENLRDELKSIYEQMTKNFVDAFSKQLIGTNGGGPLGLLLGGGMGGSVMSGLAKSGGGGPTGAQGSPFYVVPTDADGNFLQKTTGITTGVNPSSITAQMNQLPATASATSGSSAGGLGSILGLLGGVAGAAGVGTGVAGAVDGHLNSGGAEMGGLLGAGAIAGGIAIAGSSIGLGLAPMLAALGPAGWAAIAGGALIGAVAGGSIGPHYNPVTNPDMYNTNNYDQFMTNWEGTAQSFNGGPVVTPSNQYYTANGGVSQSNQIANFIDTANLSSLTSAQQNVVNQLIALNGGTTGDNLSVAWEHQGQFGLVSGQQTSVANMQSLVNQFQQLFGSTATGSPIYSIGRAYPDFNLGTLTNTGTATPANGGANAQVGNITVVVQNPTIVGPAGLNDVAVTIGQALQRTTSGTIPGSPSNYAGIGTQLRSTAQALG